MTWHDITLHFITLHYTIYITLHYTTLYYITLHCIALHCIALHYITLHTYISRYISHCHIIKSNYSFKSIQKSSWQDRSAPWQKTRMVWLNRYSSVTLITLCSQFPGSERNPHQSSTRFSIVALPRCTIWASQQRSALIGCRCSPTPPPCPAVDESDELLVSQGRCSFAEV